MMCTVKNKQALYDQIQELEYELDLLHESPVENRGVILEHEAKKRNLEDLLEVAPE